MTCRKAYLLASALLLLSLSTYPATAAPPPAEPRPGGTLIFVTEQKPAHLDPGVHTSRYTAMINQNTHDPLIWQPEPNTFVPGLAERWEIAPDFKSYTFYLRRDVKFHDGTSLNAEAVKFTWDRIRDPKTRSTRAPQLGQYVKAEVTDSYTVRVQFAEPYPQFLQAVSSVGLARTPPRR